MARSHLAVGTNAFSVTLFELPSVQNKSSLMAFRIALVYVAVGVSLIYGLWKVSSLTRHPCCLVRSGSRRLDSPEYSDREYEASIRVGALAMLFIALPWSAPLLMGYIVLLTIDR